MAYFQAIGIEKNFGGVKALINGEITIHEGKICGLLGANGSGKSTLSKIITGIYTPCKGTLLFEGKEVKINNPIEAEKLGIVMIHQHLSLIPELNVWQNIMMGRECVNALNFLDDDKSKEVAFNALSQLTNEIDLEEQVKNLSPANKQIVEIAKALSRSPKLLILDEPTAALEIAQVNKLFEILNKLKMKGVSMVFISHRMWEVTKLCNYVFVFRNGNTVGSIDFEMEGINEDLIISMITGKEIKKKDKPDRVLSKSDIIPTLEIQEISLGSILKNISITLAKGEIIGLSGLQGQGQEELLMILSGFMKKDSGTISIDGKSINLNSPKTAIRNKMVLVPGDRHEEGVFLEHSIMTNLVYTNYALKGSSIFIRENRKIKSIDAVMSKMNIFPSDRQQLVRNLSGGNQQKVVVGKWLQINPKVLLLSDPAKGVDVNAKEEMYQVVRELSFSGTSVLIYASDNEELLSLCDRILVMFEGEIVEELSTTGLTDEELIEASLGIKHQLNKMEVKQYD